MNDNITLEEALAQLEEVIVALEKPDISLEDSFSTYQKGMELVGHCTKTIDTVEKKILMLGNGGELDEF
ncbi:MAG: exodeoxyribonuclease VII small subunit [Lachnospiraceae bacterium]